MIKFIISYSLSFAEVVFIIVQEQVIMSSNLVSTLAR